LFGGKADQAYSHIAAQVSIGLHTRLGNDHGTPTGGSIPGAGSSAPDRMANAFTDLSTNDRQILTRKCTVVLAAPSRFERDTVALCKIIATL
jgi:hypothetical protein